MNAYHKSEPVPLRDELVRLRSRRADAEWQSLCDRLAVLAGPDSSTSTSTNPAPGAASNAPAGDPSLARSTLESLCLANSVDTRGGVTAGLLHHFNNVLMGVLGASRMAARSLEPGDPARPYVDEITAEAEHGVNLSRQVIDTAQQSVARFEACSGADDPASKAPAPAPKSASLRVLLVEDERLIRITLKHELQTLGHQVECAVDGHDAARVIEARGEPVDVLLTDVVVPGPTGPEIAQLARAKWPSLRVIFMSAYPRDVLLQQGRIQPSQMTLEKPFTEEQLVAKLREAWVGN
jgi:CheY-like chemotaxis protein